jgi:hypothetical protein
MTSEGNRFDGTIGLTVDESVPSWPTWPRPNADVTEFTLWPFATPVPNDATVRLLQRPFNVLATVELAANDEGVVVAQGGRFGGWTLYVQDGRLVYEHNYIGSSTTGSSPPRRSPAAESPSA